MNQNRILIEACVDSVESALNAQQGGAHRIELCSNLAEGGVTPSAGMIEIVRERVVIGLHVLIRPRGGDFSYSDDELSVMKRDIAIAKQLGAEGVALGLLHRDGSVDAGGTAALVAAARPMSVTFHRAFDVTRDASDALESLIRIGVDRVLTSGQRQSAIEGISTIAVLAREGAGRIVLMAGGGITEENATRLVTETGVREIHLSASSLQPNLAEYHNDRVSFRKPLPIDEYVRSVVDPERIRRVAQSLE